nr:hypothetical protein [Tanacetum cinerariifolium]
MSSSTTAQLPPPPVDSPTHLPPLIYYLAAFICLLGFIVVVWFAWYHITGWFAHAPAPMHPSANKRLKRRILQTLTKVTWSEAAASRRPCQEATTTQCAICLMKYEDTNEIRVLPTCQHVYHVTCIDTWFDSHSSCPTCRRVLTAEDVAS